MAWTDINKETKNNEKVPYTKFEVGATMIRILDDEPYSLWSHWLQKQQTSITCPGKNCPICNVIKQMKANKETPIYNSTQRHCMRIWNYTTNQVEIMIQGKTFFSQLLDWHKEVGPVNTYDIKVIRKGSGTDTTYSLLPQAAADFTLPEGINIDEIVLEDIMKAPTNEEILQLMEGKTWAEINRTEEVA